MQYEYQQINYLLNLTYINTILIGFLCKNICLVVFVYSKSEQIILMLLSRVVSLVIIHSHFIIDRICNTNIHNKRRHRLQQLTRTCGTHYTQIMNSLSICFLLAFSSLFNCEHRGIYYSELVKKEPNYSLAMFYDDAATVLLCGVKCYNDNCCAQFLYDKTSKKCLGLHNFEEGVISFSQISGLSDKTEQYRKGNKMF